MLHEMERVSDINTEIIRGNATIWNQIRSLKKCLLSTPDQSSRGQGFSSVFQLMKCNSAVASPHSRPDLHYETTRADREWNQEEDVCVPLTIPGRDAPPLDGPGITTHGEPLEGETLTQCIEEPSVIS